MNFLGKELSPRHDPFVIAEISCNHEGSLEKAFILIREAKDAGADAIKIQCYTPDELTIISERYDFICKDGPWKNRHLHELYTTTQTPPEFVAGMFNYAKEISIPIFSSVFGEQSLETLEKVGCPAYKIASFEVNDTNLLRKVAKLTKPVIISTGACTQKELDRANDILLYDLIIMHCVSQYPTCLENADLSRITQYRREYETPVGFSDHTIGSAAAQMAHALGACIFEKHFGSQGGNSADNRFSLYKSEFKDYVDNLKKAHKALEFQNYKHSQYKRSLYVVEDIKKGMELTKENVRSIRPSYGLDPDKLDHVVGKVADQDIPRGTALKMEMLR
jgi:pseudaminic acid synthase